MVIVSLRNKRDMSAPDTMLLTVDGQTIARAVFYPNHAAFTVTNKLTGEQLSAINSTEALEIFQRWDRALA